MPVKLSSHQDSSTPSTSPQQKSISFSDLLTKDIQIFKELSLKKKEEFYSSLSNLLESGLDIQKSLELIAKGWKKKDKELIESLVEDILKGALLSEAMEKLNLFTEYEMYSVKIGEETGNLIEVLNELSMFYSKTLKYRQQLTSALSYPLFVTLFSFGVIFFLLRYLVPMFKDVYDRFDGTLPKVTLYIIESSNFIIEYFWIAFGVCLVFSAFLLFNRNKIWFKKIFSSLLLSIPFFGKIIKLVYLSRFCQSMGLLLKSRVPLLEAISLVKRMIGFYPIQSSLNNVEKEIMNGSQLHEQLNKYDIYPKELISLLEVGEETGKTEMMFVRMSNRFSNEAEQKTNMISSVLEPVLIVTIGLLVGIILIAMYLPLFNLSTGINSY